MAYTKDTVARIVSVTETTLGNKLGRLCVEYGVPVTEVALTLRKSRQCVYNWFYGVHDVEESHREAVEKFCESITTD